MRRVALLAAVLAACVAGPASARQEATVRPEVATFCVGTGAPWKRGTLRGMTYVIALSRGTTCAFARPWVRRLSARRASRSGQSLPGPRGWQCRVTIPFGGKAAAGACARASTGFGWVPKYS